MKKLRSAAVAVTAFFALAVAYPLAAGDAMPAYLKISSPDHPQTWVAGANQYSKKLRWDDKRHQLVADVKYSNIDYADSVHPAKIDYHTLAFPSVRLVNGTDLRATDRNGDTKMIGRLQDGFFGKEVVLNRGVELNVHRIDGAIHASLVYNSLAAR
jgi:hypothetical protein